MGYPYPYVCLCVFGFLGALNKGNVFRSLQAAQILNFIYWSRVLGFRVYGLGFLIISWVTTRAESCGRLPHTSQYTSTVCFGVESGLHGEAALHFQH